MIRHGPQRVPRTVPLPWEYTGRRSDAVHRYTAVVVELDEDTRVSAWVTTVSMVFPNQTNPLGTLFGGHVLEQIDINASIACLRFCRMPVVTASTEPIDFRNPVYLGEILEVKSRVAWTGHTSMIVRCEVHGENPLSGDRRLCTVGHMSFVAVGEDGRPRLVPKLRVTNATDQQHWEVGQRVRDENRRRRAQTADTAAAETPDAPTEPARPGTSRT